MTIGFNQAGAAAAAVALFVASVLAPAAAAYPHKSFASPTHGALLGGLVGHRTWGVHESAGWTANREGEDEWKTMAGQYSTTTEALELIAANQGRLKSKTGKFEQMIADQRKRYRYILAKDEERDSWDSGYRKPAVSSAEVLGEHGSKVDPEHEAVADGLGTRKANVGPRFIRTDPVQSATVSDAALHFAQASWNYMVSVNDTLYTVRKDE